MKHHQLNSAKWGGAGLTIGTLGYAIAIVLYVTVYGQPESTAIGGTVSLSERVDHLRMNWQFAQLMWWIEVVAAILIAVSGFLLARRPSQGGSFFTPQLAWTIVGVGGILLFMMYPVMLAGYPEAMRYFDDEPGLMAVLNEVAVFIFNIANLVLLIGLAAGFAAEKSQGRNLSNWLKRLGVGVCLLAAFGFVGMAAGSNAMEVLAPLGVLAFVISGFLGLSIYRGSGT